MQDLESILARINQRQSELNILRQNLNNVTIKEALKVEFLYESNRIEGNTLTLRETQLVINEGMTISGKSMREHLEAINHKGDHVVNGQKTTLRLKKLPSIDCRHQSW